MAIFYKYLSYIDENTFKRPTVRLSVPMHLNDPFESAICNIISEELRTNYNLLNKEDIRREIFDSITRDQINQYGIVSLSETSRNLLMWAHYANEHSGICIGYKDDFLDSLEKPIETDHGGHFKPTRVMYDSLRYYKDNNEVLPPPSELCFRILTNKSNDWIYEKEHRCIVPLFWADYIKFKGELPQDIKDSLNTLKNIDIDVSIKNNDEYHIHDIEDRGMRFIFSLNKNSVFIKEINPSKIDRIYFGCRYPKKDMREIIEEIKNPNHCLNHVKIYKYELDPTRFELNEILLHPKVIK